MAWLYISRVFSDRLIDEKDRESFVTILTEKLANLFDQTYHNICPNKQPPIFGKTSSVWSVHSSLDSLFKVS